MADLLDVRETLADNIRTMVGDTLNVYSYPAESLALPAAVLVPGNPWWEPGQFGMQPQATAASAVRIRLDVQLIVPRTEVEEAIKSLESFGVAIGMALASDPVMRWVSMLPPSPITVGEIDGLAVIIETTGKV